MTGTQTFPKFDITQLTHSPSELLKEIKKRLYSHMLPEKTFPFEKMQRNFIYQFLSKDTRRELEKLTIPKHLEPSAKNYEGYIRTILDYSNRHPDEEILSLQTFAGHGFIVNGN